MERRARIARVSVRLKSVEKSVVERAEEVATWRLEAAQMLPRVKRVGLEAVWIVRGSEGLSVLDGRGGMPVRILPAPRTVALRRPGEGLSIILPILLLLMGVVMMVVDSQGCAGVATLILTLRVSV